MASPRRATGPGRVGGGVKVCQDKSLEMPRVCTVCTHKKRKAIDAALVANGSFRDISKRWGVSIQALNRHKAAHIPAALAKASAAQEVANADDLMERLDKLDADAKRIGAKAEKAKNYHAALAAVRELVRIVELLAKLRGELNERPQTNILVTSADWIETRTVLMNALQPFPAARIAAASALTKHEESNVHGE